MNKATADRLKNNPHYKLSAAQEIEADQFAEPKAVEFGAVPMHNQSVPLHNPEIPRRARSGKKWYH